MQPNFVPRKFFLTRGVGVHKDKLVSFEMALRDARIPQFNLVTVSSILPPGCEQVSPDEGLRELAPGQIVFCVLSRHETNQPRHPIAASVGIARPADFSHHGYIAEHHASAEPEETVERHVRWQAVSMLATCLGAPPEVTIDDRLMDPTDPPGFLEQTLTIVQFAPGSADGSWTTVLAAAVFILE